MVLDKTLESPLDCKEIQPVHPKGDQSWIFIGRTDAEDKAPILWPPDANWLIGKDLDAGQDWRQEEKGTMDDECLDGITASKDMSLRSSGSWWWTRKPDMLQFVGSQMSDWNKNIPVMSTYKMACISVSHECKHFQDISVKEKLSL